MVLGGTGSRECGIGQYLMILGQYRSVLVDSLWYWVSIERYWLVYDGTGSVWVNTCWYLVVLDQYMAVMVDTRGY